jgi:superfamily II DNA or RNA helicase
MIIEKSLLREEALAQRAPSNNPIVPRPDQLSLACQLNEILGRAEHAYLEAPTGTGKTLTIALAGRAFRGHTKIFLANTVDLVKQARTAFASFDRSGLIDITEWRFLTWMKYVSSAKNELLATTLDTSSPHIAFVDECHIGGTITPGQAEKISFPIIRQMASRTVWVSATPWDVDETLLGERRGHTAQFTTQEAHAAGLVNDVDLVRIDCGLKLKVAVSNLELAHGTRFHNLAAQSFEIEGREADELLDMLYDHSPERDLALRDVKSIVKHRYRLMANHYLTHNNGQKAIFWLPNQQYAKECAAHIAAALSGNLTAEPIISHYEGSVAEAEYTQAALASFKNPQGDVAVVCAVYRLREGFDLPTLHLGYDCSWNPYNIRASVQKIGRLQRKCENKPRSLYHYAVDVKTVLGANSDFSETYIDALTDNLNVPEIAAQAAAEAIFENSKFKNILGIEQANILSVNASTHKFANRSYDVTKTPLFDFEAAEGFAELDRHSLGDILTEQKTRKDLLLQMLDEMDNGREWESFPADTRASLCACANPRTGKTIAEIKARIETDYPHLVPKSRSTARLERSARVFAMLDQIDNGRAWLSFSDHERTEMQRAANIKATKTYIPEFAELIQRKYPNLLPTSMAQKGQNRIQGLMAILDEIALGREWKSIPPTDRSKLTDAANPKLKTYTEVIAERIKRQFPDILPVERSLKHQTRMSRLSAYFDEMDQGREWLSFSAHERLEIKYALNPKRQMIPALRARAAFQYPQLLPKAETTQQARLRQVKELLDEMDAGRPWQSLSRKQRAKIRATTTVGTNDFDHAIQKRFQRDYPALSRTKPQTAFRFIPKE